MQVPSSSRVGLSSPEYPSSFAFRICWRTASTMGITMVTADVFWTHIERKAQPDMKPSNNLKETVVCSKSNNGAFTLKSRRNTKFESNSRERRCSPSRVDPHQGDEPQGDSAVEAPLLDGRGKADNTHKQEVEVIKILLCHLEEKGDFRTESASTG